MARLAVAAILIFEATNKMNMVSGATNFNVTVCSLIFMLVMKNIQKWGLTGVKLAFHDEKNPLFLPKNFEIQNLPLIHLPIYKQIFFSGSSDEKKFQFFWLNQLKGQKFFFSSDDPGKKISLYIGKWINGKF